MSRQRTPGTPLGYRRPGGIPGSRVRKISHSFIGPVVKSRLILVQISYVRSVTRFEFVNWCMLFRCCGGGLERVFGSGWFGTVENVGADVLRGWFVVVVVVAKLVG